MQGGDNIFSDVSHPYPEISNESLMKRAPEIIIETRPGQKITDKQRKQIISEWNVFKRIPAVLSHKVHILTENFILIPGPRVGMAACLMAKTIYGPVDEGYGQKAINQ